jgi:hypothetical protein
MLKKVRPTHRVALLGLSTLVAGAAAVGVAAPSAHAAAEHPNLTYVYGYYYGATAGSSGCSQVGGIGYSQGWWLDWSCYKIYNNNSNPSLNEWELIVTD